jgi:hypothetical protein
MDRRPMQIEFLSRRTVVRSLLAYISGEAWEGRDLETISDLERYK